MSPASDNSLSPLPLDAVERTPPGQSLTRKFPVLHYGNVPIYRDPEREWNLRFFGEIAEERTFTFSEFRSLPTVSITCDIHCVTRWSKLDTQWEGVRFKTILNTLSPLNEGVAFIMAHCEYGYTTNLPLEVLFDDDVLLAYRYDGAELDPDHGYPLRLLIPKKYFWKSAKWLRGIEFLKRDKLGFWERNGYHNHADPWNEERFSDY